MITLPNQADKEMHSNDVMSRNDEDVSMTRGDTVQSHHDKNQLKEKKNKRKDIALSKTPSAILNKNNSN